MGRADSRTRKAGKPVATAQRGLRAPTLHLTIVCRLHELRGDRSLTTVQQATGINRGTLSQLERGERLPRPAQVAGLERAYGPRERWYAVEVLAEEAAA